MFLHILSTAGRFALFELIRMLTGRFREVGSSTNWVNWVWFGATSISFCGKCFETRFRRAGNTRDLVSAVALHLAITWTKSSTGARVLGCRD